MARRVAVEGAVLRRLLSVYSGNASRALQIARAEVTKKNAARGRPTDAAAAEARVSLRPQWREDAAARRLMPSSKATAEEHNSVDEIERREMVRSMLGDKSLSSRRTVEDLALLRRVQERGPGAQPTEEEAEAIKRLADNTLSHAERRNDLLRNPPDERESLRKLPADYASLSEHMRAKGESPRPVDVYAQLLRVHAAKGSPESVDAVVREMRERGVPLNLYVYGALVHSCAAHGDAERARKFMRELEEVDGLKPTVAVYGCYIDALTRTGNLDEALSVVDKLSAEDSPVKPNAVIYTSLIRGCFHANRTGRAWKVYQMMVESGAEADAVTGSLLIRMCAHKKECERAEMIFGDLVRKGEVPDVKLYSALIRCFATRYDYYPKAFEAFKAMVAMGIRPNREVFTSLLVACSRIGDLESAERVMNQMAEFRVEKDDIVYNTFIAAIANSQQYPRMKVGGVEATVEQRITLAVNTLAELRERGIPISLATLNSMLGVYAYANRIKRSEAFFREAYAKFGMQPDQFSYLAMMRMYARTKQVAKGRALYQEFLDKKLPPLKTFFRKAIVLFGATRQFLSAQRVLDDMRRFRIAPGPLDLERAFFRKQEWEPLVDHADFKGSDTRVPQPDDQPVAERRLASVTPPKAKKLTPDITVPQASHKAPRTPIRV